MAKPIYVLNGPNLNRLGTREPEIYGTTTLAEIEAMCREAAGGHPIKFLQSNHEGEIVEWIHEAIDAAAPEMKGQITYNPEALALPPHVDPAPLEAAPEQKPVPGTVAMPANPFGLTSGATSRPGVVVPAPSPTAPNRSPGESREQK